MLIVDFESTGVASSFYSLVCEVSIIFVENNVIKDYYSSLIKSPKHFETHFTEGIEKTKVIHGITNANIEANGKEIEVVASDVREFINKYYKEKTSEMFAWNYAVDKIFMMKLFMFSQQPDCVSFVEDLNWKEIMPKYKTGLDRFLTTDILDSSYKLVEQNKEMLKLWTSQKRHRAFFDAVMELAVMLKYRRKHQGIY